MKDITIVSYCVASPVVDSKHFTANTMTIIDVDETLFDTNDFFPITIQYI